MSTPGDGFGPRLNELANTLNAGWWERLCVRLFGRRHVVHDGLFHVLLLEWRGRFYLMDFWRENDDEHK